MTSFYNYGFTFILCCFWVACSDTRGQHKTFGEGEVFYTPKITEQEAMRFGTFMNEKQRFFENGRVTFQLDRSERNNAILVRMVSKPNTENRAEMLDAAKALTWGLSEEVFENQPVNFHFCSEKDMKTIKEVQFEFIGKKNALCQGRLVVYAMPNALTDLNNLEACCCKPTILDSVGTLTIRLNKNQVQIVNAANLSENKWLKPLLQPLGKVYFTDFAWRNLDSI